jgi:hypothetical protein
MKIRRLVVGNDEHGKSVIISDGETPHVKEFDSTPGLGVARIWSLPANATTTVPADEPTAVAGPILPAPGAASFLIIQYAPDSVALSAGFDPVAAGTEFAESSPDMAALMEADAPGMHRTDTVDHAIVLSGSIWLELDDGVQIELHPGDTVVQVGSRHAWRNKTSQPATVAFVMIGAARE